VTCDGLRTVDGLKKALLKECAHRILKDKYVADLKVYPTGKERGLLRRQDPMMHPSTLAPLLSDPTELLLLMLLVG